jgi:hypothetical protein
MAETKQARGRGRFVGLLLIGGLVLAAAAGLAYILVDDGSSESSAKPESPTKQAPAAKSSASQALPLQSFRGHRLLTPECTPLQGRRWAYPLGPPVKGLPDLTADIHSSTYEVFAVHYPCKEAKTWIRKLSQQKIPVLKSGNVTVLEGPAGYYCSAWPDASGYAYAGGCQLKGGGECTVTGQNIGRPYANGKGCKLIKGKKAFGWNWNVANRRVVFAHDKDGVVHLIHVSGSDTNVVFRYLSGTSYQLEVLNTSGIGYLNRFSWQPSPGWSVTGINKTTGAACSLSAAGKIVCKGSVHPPSCLCGADGGTVTIRFTAAPTKKDAGYLFGGSAAQFKIDKMTPVPYIIPGTPEEAAKRRGI